MGAGYLVGGKDTTTHSDLPRNCERYLIAYCAWKIFKRDSSMDSGDQQAELSAMEQDFGRRLGTIKSESPDQYSRIHQRFAN